MRIALVVPVFPAISETFISSKFVALNKSGLESYIVCQHIDREQLRVFRQRHGKAYCNKIKKAWPHGNWLIAAALFPVALFWALAAGRSHVLDYFTKRWKVLQWGIFKQIYLDSVFLTVHPDILHFEFGPLAVERAYLKDILRCRFITSFRGYDINYSGMEIPGYYDRVWKESDALHFLSQSLHRRALDRGCPAEISAKFIPPAVNLEYYCPSGHTSSRLDKGKVNSTLNLLSVGRLDWVKGYEYALLAVRQVLDNGFHCHLRIIGGGPFAEAIFITRRRLGLADIVELTGFRSPESIRQSLQECDVFLQSSVSEGFCNAVVEAQATGVPVVCTDAGGLPENVEDGVSGIVVPRRNPRAMAEALCTLASNPQQRRRMGNSARNRALKHFGQPDQIQKFIELYRRVEKGR